MRVSNRPVKYRTIRDWWVKGLLPRPDRLWSQRASVSCWRDDRVLAQAKTAYDLLRRRGARYDRVLVQLWLSGYPIPPHRIRRSAIKFLSSIKFYPKDGHSAGAIDHMEVRMGRFAQDLVKQFFPKTAGISNDRSELVDSIMLGLSILFQPGGAADEDASGLATVFRWMGDLHSTEPEEDWVQQVARMGKLVMDDVGIEPMLGFLRPWINVVSQADAVEKAPDLTFVRARRTMLVVVNLLRKIARRCRANIGDMPNKMKALAIEHALYLIGAYIKLIDSEAYPQCRRMLIDFCAKARAMA